MKAGEERPGAGVTPRSRLRVPHLLLDEGEVHAAVANLLRDPLFVIDLETTRQRAQVNEVLWIGLGGYGQVYLIPLRHPNGWLLSPEHKEKTPAYVHFGPEDPRAYTPLGKPSMRMIEHTVEAVYTRPPKFLDPDVVFAALHPLLFSDRAKLGHNVKYDLQSIAKYYANVIPPGPYHDTIVLRHVLEEERDSYELKALVCCPSREGGYGLKREKYPNLGDLGVENFALDEVARYLAKDLRYPWMMFHNYHSRLVRRGLQGVYDFEMSLYPTIMGIESHGFPVDRSKLGYVRTDLEKSIRDIEQQCYVMTGDEWVLSNSEAKRWVLFGEGKRKTKRGEPIPSYGLSKRPLKSQRLKPLGRTPVDKLPKVTQQVLEHYAERGNAMASFLLEWSILEKLRGTFIEGLDSLLDSHPLAASGALPRIHTSFKQHGTVTGRLSSASPNLQQLPRGSRIRDLFCADTGHVLIVADYDQIELRCLAHEAQERTMMKIFRQGLDIHAEATAAAMQIPIEMVTSDLRQVGKVLNFATGYGAGAERIAAVARTSVQRGQNFLNRYYERFSGLQPWKRQILAEARRRGDRTNPLHDPPYVLIPPIGRLRRLPLLYSPEDWERWRAERQAINAIIQGFASYITKMAMLVLDQELPNYPAQMVVQVHDEIVVRVDERYVDDVLPVVVRSMDTIQHNGDPILGSIPLVVSAQVGYTWAEAKGAKKAAVIP